MLGDPALHKIRRFGLPDQMFQILVHACLTENQFKFGFNRITIVFALCLTL